MGMEDYGICLRVDARLFNEISDEHTFPEYRDIPDFETVESDDL